jgi:hypothetical protein
VPGDCIEERPLGIGRLEDRQHQRSCPAVVTIGAAAVEVASIGTQALRSPRRRSVAALDIQ